MSDKRTFLRPAGRPFRKADLAILVTGDERRGNPLHILGDNDTSIGVWESLARI